MTDEPYIDVIIPTYNGLPWLESTIDSVLSQTYEKIKVYIIDDGSKDETKTFVKSIRDSRLTYIKKKNGGVSSARNIGIKKSDSPYVTFLDSDDLWREDKLEKQLSKMKSDEEIGMVYGHHYIIDDEDIIQGNLRIWERGHLFDSLVKGNFIAGSASMVMIKRSILEEVGLFREDFLNGEDWEMWLRISKICVIDFVPEIIASIRVHDASAQANTSKMASALVYAYGEMKNSLVLTESQKRLLASYCLFNSAIAFYSLKEYAKARQTLMMLFRENPPAFTDLENWKVSFGIGVFCKILLTQPILHTIARCVAFPFRILRRIIRLLIKILGLGLRALRKIIRLSTGHKNVD